MSYARFGTDSSVYVYAGGIGYECCGCRAFNGKTQSFHTTNEIIDHLQMHQNADDSVPGYTFVELGMQLEQERIIKLLEQYYLETRIEIDVRGQVITQSYSIDLIALIKGENK
jgi:hypothetical protein